MNSNLLKRIKKITLLFIIILIVEVIYIIYSICFKNNMNLYFDSINAFNSNSSYIVTVGSNNNNDNYYEKAKITKYNKKHEKEAEKLFNFGYNSVFFDVSVDNDNIIAVGSYEKSRKQHDNSIRRALFVMYDSNFEEISYKDFKVLDNSKFTSIVNVSDGYLVAGQSVYRSTKIGSSEGGALLVKYDKDGNVIWSKTFGNNKSSIFNDLIVVNDYIYAVGLLKDNISVICKYDLNGNFISSKNFDNTDNNGFNDIIYINNKLYISGSLNNKASIIMCDVDFNYIKDISYKGKGISYYSKMDIDKNNNIICIGSVNESNYDGLIGKYDLNLKEISTVVYGEENDDFFTDIMHINNNYLVSGYSSYGDGSYLSKFIKYSDALKVLEVG